MIIQVLIIKNLKINLFYFLNHLYRNFSYESGLKKHTNRKRGVAKLN